MADLPSSNLEVFIHSRLLETKRLHLFPEITCTEGRRAYVFHDVDVSPLSLLQMSAHVFAQYATLSECAVCKLCSEGV